jgi:chromosome segregation ATPase
MDKNSPNAISQLEQALLKILKEEYSFYQSLYILLDKQRDTIKFDRDDNLLDLYAEIERCQRRIKESEQKVTAIRENDPRLFRLASVYPEVRKMVNSIITLVKKNLNLIEDNKEYVANRYDRIKTEMDELKNSRKILQYMADPEPASQFWDGKK